MSKPILCYVTDRKALPSITGAHSSDSLLQQIAQAARAGVDWIQLREKDLDAGPLLALAGQAVAACAASASAGRQQTQLLVNDRLDVAWTAGATGVHLGENSLPIAEVTRWRIGAGHAGFRVGASCHSLDAATQAAAAGADYLFFGPVFATPSKLAFGDPQGLRKLEQVCRAVPVPVLAIGGISAENAADCLRSGAAGIAAIRLFQQPPEALAEIVGRICA